MDTKTKSVPTGSHLQHLLHPLPILQILSQPGNWQEPAEACYSTQPNLSHEQRHKAPHLRDPWLQTRSCPWLQMLAFSTWPPSAGMLHFPVCWILSWGKHDDSSNNIVYYALEMKVHSVIFCVEPNSKLRDNPVLTPASLNTKKDDQLHAHSEFGGCCPTGACLLLCYKVHVTTLRKSLRREDTSGSLKDFLNLWRSLFSRCCKRDVVRMGRPWMAADVVPKPLCTFQT